MKILIIRSFPSFINLKKNSYNQQEIGLAKAFLSLGHQVGIVYFSGDCHSDELYETLLGNIYVYYRKAKVLLNRIAFYELFDDLKVQYDFLILNEYDQLETYKTLKKYGSKSCVYHGSYYAKFNKRYNIYNKVYDMMFIKKLKKLNPLIFTKSKLAKEYLEVKGLTNKACVGVGLDTEQLVDFNDCNKSIYNSRNKQLLYIGKIEPRRNPQFLIRLLYKINSITNNEYHLTIIGEGNQDCVFKMKSLIKKLGQTDNISYIEKLQQKELAKYYKKADFFLLPTSYEIWGMVIMEALKYDLPVITTYNGGSSSLIVNNVNGMILNLNEKEWINSIQNINFDKDKLHKYNKKLLQEKYNWKIIAKKMIGSYLELEK